MQRFEGVICGIEEGETDIRNCPGCFSRGLVVLCEEGEWEGDEGQDEDDPSQIAEFSRPPRSGPYPLEDEVVGKECC